MRGRKLALRALAQPINDPSPHRRFLGKGLALFFPPNNGFPLCKDLSPFEEWLAKDDPLGFLNYPALMDWLCFSTKPWICPLQEFNPRPR